VGEETTYYLDAGLETYIAVTIVVSTKDNLLVSHTLLLTPSAM
jgi:hypothetical protein